MAGWELGSTSVLSRPPNLKTDSSHRRLLNKGVPVSGWELLRGATKYKKLQRWEQLATHLSVHPAQPRTKTTGSGGPSRSRAKSKPSSSEAEAPFGKNGTLHLEANTYWQLLQQCLETETASSFRFEQWWSASLQKVTWLWLTLGTYFENTTWVKFGTCKIFFKESWLKTWSENSLYDNTSHR